MPKRAHQDKNLKHHLEKWGTLPDPLTSGQFASLVGVANRTISKWVDSGRLPGAFRIPGSQDRRIPLAVAIRFCRENGLPDIVAAGRPAIDYVGTPPSALLTIGPVTQHVDGFALCLDVPRGIYRVLCLDSSIHGRELTKRLVRALRGVDVQLTWRIVVVRHPDDAISFTEDSQQFLEAGAAFVSLPEEIVPLLSRLAWGYVPDDPQKEKVA